MTIGAGEQEPENAGQRYDPAVVRAFLFDLGGVLIGLDFDRVFRVWAEKANCDPDELRARFRQDDDYERHERGELDSTGYFAALRNTLGIVISDADFLLGWNDIYLDPVAGMASLVRAASQRMPCYVFTNSNPSHQAVWSELLRDELQLFASIFVSSDLGVRKPDPIAFSLVAELTGHPPSDFLFFDDTPANLVGAKAAGMQAVLVRSARDLHAALSLLGI